MNDPSARSEGGIELIEVLIDEHVQIDCNIIPIDDGTWAIHGSIAVDGNLILAEFDSKEDAEDALERIAAAQARAEGTIP